MKTAPININQSFQGKLVYDKEQVAKKISTLGQYGSDGSINISRPTERQQVIKVAKAINFLKDVVETKLPDDVTYQLDVFTSSEFGVANSIEYVTFSAKKVDKAADTKTDKGFAEKLKSIFTKNKETKNPDNNEISCRIYVNDPSFDKQVARYADKLTSGTNDSGSVIDLLD